MRAAPLEAGAMHARSPCEAFCRVAGRFSGARRRARRSYSMEIDLNPVIVHADGCAIVDALVVPQQAQGPNPNA